MKSTGRRCELNLKASLPNWISSFDTITTEGNTVKKDLAVIDQRIFEINAMRETVKADQNALGALTTRIDQSQADLDLWKKKIIRA